MGDVPGPLVATLSHCGELRQISVHVARHPRGGWHVRRPCGAHGPRCHSVPAAILLEAGDAFATPAPPPTLAIPLPLRLEAPLAA